MITKKEREERRERLRAYRKAQARMATYGKVGLEYREWVRRQLATETIEADEKEQSAPYLPTPEEIAEMCFDFQQEWTPAEKARRRGTVVEPLEIDQFGWERRRGGVTIV